MWNFSTKDPGYAVGVCLRRTRCVPQIVMCLLRFCQYMYVHFSMALFMFTFKFFWDSLPYFVVIFFCTSSVPMTLISSIIFVDRIIVTPSHFFIHFLWFSKWYLEKHCCEILNDRGARQLAPVTEDVGYQCSCEKGSKLPHPRVTKHGFDAWFLHIASMTKRSCISCVY